MSLLKTYTLSSFLSLIAKSSTIVTQLALLYVANQMLDKPAFGLFILAQTITLTVTMTISSPWFGLMLYRITKFEEPEESAEAQEIASVFFWLSALTGFIFLLLVALAAAPLSAVMNKAGLELWLILLAIGIPFDTARITLAHWHRARGDIKTLTFYQETFPNILRLLLLFTAYILLQTGFNAPYITLCGAWLAGSIIPLIALFIRRPFPFRLASKLLTKKDIAQGLHGISAWLATEPSRSLDVILVGALASASATADYATASRIARLLTLPKLMISQLALPRLGRLAAKEGSASAAAEYALVQYIPFVLTLGGIAVLMLIGPFILSLFGEYQNAFPIMILLGYAGLVAAAFGTGSGLLGIVGEAEKALQGGLLGLVTMVILGPLMAQVWQGEGMACAFILSNFVSYFYYSLRLKRDHYIPFMPRSLWAALFVVGFVTACFIVTLINAYLAAFLLLATLCVQLALDRQWLTFWKGRSHE